MKRVVLVGQLVALATFIMPMSVSAQWQQFDAMRIEDEAQPIAGLPVAPALELSVRVHDDWALVATPVGTPLDLSPRIHDDWAIAASSSAPSLDLSPRTYDDWPLASAN